MATDQYDNDIDLDEDIVEDDDDLDLEIIDEADDFDDDGDYEGEAEEAVVDDDAADDDDDDDTTAAAASDDTKAADTTDDDDDVVDLDDDEDDEDEETLEVLLGPDSEATPAGPRKRSDDSGDAPPGEGEFTCRSCFLVKRRPQLADATAMICLDCA